MEHWTQKCDGSSCPAEYIKVCKERDELKAALDGAKLSMKALNEKLVEITAERDALVEIARSGVDSCDWCKNSSGINACTFEGVCSECPSEVCKCKTCYEGINFEFAGIEEVGNS